MYQFGLKLWSTNDNYVAEAIRLQQLGIYSYIELYAVPGSYDVYISVWKSLKIPFVIHAAHFRDGMNLAKREKEAMNRLLITEARQYADDLKADKIIIHPGIAGDIRETVRQLKQVKDQRILIENKPYHALDDGLICNGTAPEEIALIMDKTGVRFCLDIGHAICSANAHKQEPYAYLRQFLELKPKILHLTDGDINGMRDVHRHFGQGNFDLSRILALLPKEIEITVETEKDRTDRLDDFVADLNVIKNYVSTLEVGVV